MKMNRNTKIILGIGAGVGLAYLLFGRKKTSPTSKMPMRSMESGETESDVETPDVALEDALNEPETREEQIAFILENADMTVQEELSTFEGTKFVWNKNFGRYYPTGTIVEGKMPQYAESVFGNFEGDSDPTEEAIDSINGLSDKELLLAVNLVKYKKFNPKEINEAMALKEISNNDPKLVEIVKTRILPRLNDVKMLRTSPNWKERWKARKEKLKSIREKAKKCGRRPVNSREKLAEWKKCIKSVRQERRDGQDDVSEFMLTKRIRERREEIKSVCGNPPKNKKDMNEYVQCANRVRKQMQEDSGYGQKGSPFKKVKSKKSSFSGVDYNKSRQAEFVREMTNRNAGGMFGGRRWDGKTNEQEDAMVRKGLNFSGADGEMWNEARQNDFAQQVINRNAGGMFAGRRFDGRSNTAEEILVREGKV